MPTMREEILRLIPNEQGRTILLSKRVFRAITRGNSIEWRNVTPPKQAESTSLGDEDGIAICIDDTFLGQEPTAENLMEFISSRMVNIYVVSAYWSYKDPKNNDNSWDKLFFTTGTPEIVQACLEVLSQQTKLLLERRA